MRYTIRLILRVSTHAPLARCGKFTVSILTISNVSTHAPLARCGMKQDIIDYGTDGFNSRTSCEVRRNYFRGQRLRPSFNSRTSCEVRHNLRGVKMELKRFNSRTSCEVRLDYKTNFRNNLSFNSRTSCEVRLTNNGLTLFRFVFQLTHLLRGAAHTRPQPLQCAYVSTHAPLARCGWKF